MSELVAVVAAECERLAAALDDERIARLSAYFALLVRWGQRIRLTGTHEPAEVVRRHLADALVIHRELAHCAPRSLLDVGSGGGLPALPLCALFGGLEATLVEANKRKATFLRTAAHELSMGGRIQVLDQRFEATTLASTFDWVCSRATFAPSEWLRRAAPHVAVKGRVMVFVGREESAPERQLVDDLGLGLDLRQAYQLADGTPRLLLSYRREA
jgi:16S rRNA (guanine527-N7)-methyltransferase